MEKLNSAVLLANTWCFFGGVGGYIDATYQEFHEGNHLGTAIADKAVHWWEDTTEWYESKERGVDNFIRGVEEWWRS